MSQVFVSYSRKDMELVRPFYELASKQEKNLWIDWNGIYPTEDFMEKIFREIEASDACVFMLSPSWLSSKPCQLEFEHAVRCNKRLIPILCAPVEKAAVPMELARLSWIHFRAGDSITQTLEEVYLAVDIDLKWVREHSQLLRSAAHWETHQRDPSYCLRGRELRELEKRISLLKNDTGPTLTPVQMQFLAASRRRANSTMRTIITTLSSTVVFFLALALFATVMYFQAERRSTLVSAQHLASRARLILQQRADWLDPCAQAAADAVLRLSNIGEPSVEANYALQTVGGLLPVRKSVMSHPSAVWDISVDDKGSRLACRYADYGQMPEKWNAPDTGTSEEPERTPNRKVPIWNLETNQMIREIEWTGQDVIEDVQISHSGKLVLIASTSQFEVWDIDNNRRISQIEEANLKAVTFSHDDSQVVVFADSAKFFSISGTLVQDLGLRARIYASGNSSLSEKHLIFHTEAIEENTQSATPDNVELLLLQLQKKMNARTGNFSIWRKRNGWEPSNVVPFSSGSQALAKNYGWAIRDADDTAVLFQGKGVEVWNLEEEKRIAFFEVGNEVELAAIHPTEPVIAVATVDKISLWRIEDDEANEVAVIGGVAYRLQFSPDGRYLATASNDNTARIWSMRDGNREAFRLVHEFWIGRIEFCGRSDRVLTACGFQALSHPDQAKVRDWELRPTWKSSLPFQSAASYLEGDKKSEMLTQSGIPTISNGWLGITSIAGNETKLLANLSGDESQFVDVSLDGTTAILAAKSIEYESDPSFQVVGAAAERFKLPSKVETIDLSPDGARIAIGAANHLQVLEQGSEKPVFDKTFEVKIDGFRFAPDSQQAAISLGDGKAVKLLRLSDGSTTDIGAADRTTSIFGFHMHFSPNSEVLALDGLDTVEVWKLSTVPQQIYRIEDSVDTGAISRSGNYLALKPHDRTVRIVDLRLGNVITRVQDVEQILTCAFSPDEKYLATGSGDLLEQPKSNSIRIWEVSSGRLLFQQDELVNPLELEFTTSGDELLIRRQDQSISIYRWQPDRLVKEVGARLTGNMSKETWSDLLPGVDFSPTFAHLPIIVESE